MAIRNVELMHDCLSVFPNTCTWEQQESNKMKKVRED